MRFVLLLAFALPVLAQEPEALRGLIERDQQSAEFALRLKQSQESPRPPPADNRHVAERQRLENVGDEQARSVRKDLPPELRAYERQRASDERTLALPPPVVRAPEPMPLRPLVVEPFAQP
jgi:hypothetical protein